MSSIPPTPVRIASTILVLARTPTVDQSVTKCNYKILMMQRSKNMKFMGGLYAFPGMYIMSYVNTVHTRMYINVLR